VGVCGGGQVGDREREGGSGLHPIWCRSRRDEAFGQIGRQKSLGTEKENRRQGAGFSYGSGGWDGGAVASIGPLAESEEGAGKAGRAQDIGGDVTEGERDAGDREGEYA
jgi:hypothetical protein